MYPGRDLRVKGKGVMLTRFTVSMEAEMKSGIVVAHKKPGLACRLHSSFQTDATDGVWPAYMHYQCV
jgi:hypothetical protein